MRTPIRPRATAPATMLIAAALAFAAPGLTAAPPPPPAGLPTPPPPIPTSAPTPVLSATIRDLAFLSGCWQSRTPDGAFLEEHWSAPEGPSMMGMFRWLHPGGAPALFEILTLTDEADGGVALRLRHFSPTLEAKEDKDKPMTLRLEELEKGRRAVFLPTAHAGQAARVIYERTGPDTLVFTLHFIDEAARDPLRLSFTRAAPTPPSHPTDLAADESNAAELEGR